MSIHEIASNITQHTIVYCVEKQERAIAVQQMLGQAGYKVVLALSYYDALKLISQEMPHLIVCEAILTDGNAGNLYDKLQQDPILKQIPIMLQILKKNRDELAVITNRKFASFYMGPVDQKSFLAKLKETVAKFTLVSPFFYDLELCGQKTDITLNVDALVVGCIGEQMIARSSTELDPAATIVCTPKASELAPISSRMPSNIKFGEEYFNIFPLSRIVGKGKLWVKTLKQIDMSQLKAVDTKFPVTKVPRRILFHDPTQERIDGFREILSGYDIELVPALSIPAVTDILKREPDSIGGIYIHEMTNDTVGVELRTVYAKIHRATRPPMVIATTTPNMKNVDTTRYLRRPFGVGVFVEALEATFQRGNNLAAAVTPASNAPKNSAPAGVPVVFQTFARILGLDETGGVIELKTAIGRGAKINLGGNPFYSSLLGGQLTVEVTNCVPTPGKQTSWQARFAAVGLGLSKVKYWEKISKVLSVEADKYAKVMAEKLAAEQAAAAEAAAALAASQPNPIENPTENPTEEVTTLVPQEEDEVA